MHISERKASIPVGKIVRGHTKLAAISFQTNRLLLSFKMGAKQSKGIPNPFTCLRGLGRKNEMCSNVVVNGRTSEPAPSELRSRNPTSRRGWISSDLVLEDVDIEAETYGIAPAVLPPVIPPPGMRGAAYMTRHHEQELLDAMYLNIPIYDDGYSPLSDEEDEEVGKKLSTYVIANILFGHA